MKRNRDRLRDISLYDLLIRMQTELDYAREHDGDPCILDLLGENIVGLRCTKYNRKCEQCVQDWLNEYDYPF